VVHLIQRNAGFTSYHVLLFEDAEQLDDTSELRLKTENGSTKIVGGENANIKDYPYAVQIRYQTPEGPLTFGICGGVIIAKKVILTVAHCPIDAMNVQDYIVYSTDKLTKDGKIIFIAEVHRHPLYSKNTLANDIAVIILKDKMKFNENASLIKMAKYKHDRPGKKMLTCQKIYS